MSAGSSSFEPDRILVRLKKTMIANNGQRLMRGSAYYAITDKEGRLLLQGQHFRALKDDEWELITTKADWDKLLEG